MSARPESRTEPASNAMPEPPNVPLPPDATLQRIAFVSQLAPNQTAITRLRPPMTGGSILLQDGASSGTKPEDEYPILRVPARNADTIAHPDAEVLSLLRNWVESASREEDTPGIFMSFHGVHIHWTPRRCAIYALADRLDALCKAVAEVTYYDRELRDVEQLLCNAWPQWEQDLPLAFEFEDRSLAKRPGLRRQFQQLVLGRARIARLGPVVNAPHLHPPTLASQVNERLRERTQMAHRHESLSDQLEVFEWFYEMCGQRVSDLVHTRSSNLLEWVIIILLLVQLLLSSFEILTATATGE